MLRTYSQIPEIDYNAQKYYRVLLPLISMSKLKRAVPFVDFGSHTMDDQRAAIQTFSSMHWLHHFAGPDFQSSIEHYAGAPARWLPLREPGPDGPEWDAPPSFALDTDDDLFNVAPQHTGTFRWAGIRNEDGSILQPGDSIGLVDEATGEKQILWQDGKDGFDISRNRELIHQWRMNLALAAMVTASTRPVEKSILREVPNANTFWLPNCIDFEAFPSVELIKHTNKVRLLWQGGSGHEQCLGLIVPSLKKILAKYPNVELVIWGGMPQSWAEQFPAEQTRWLPWVDYREFKLRLNMINHDIALAPLFPNKFNEGRSGIKAYESAACWHPAMTIASNFGPFADDIEDGVTGLLFDDAEQFETKLSFAIEDSLARQTMAENMKDWVRTHRDPMKHAERLADKMDSIRVIKKGLWAAPPAEPEKIIEQPISAE